MSKFYEVQVQATKLVLVEVEDDDNDPAETAMNIAANEAFDGGDIECAVTGADLAGEALDRSKRHAHEKVFL